MKLLTNLAKPKVLGKNEKKMLDLSFESPKPKIISGAKFDWELVIGMEVHAQVASASVSYTHLTLPTKA